MLTTINTINLLPQNKSERISFAQNVKSEMLSKMNRDEVLKTMLTIKSAIDTLEMIYKDEEIKSLAIESMLNEKEIKLNTGIISQSTRKTFNFANDSKWHALNGEIKLKQTQLKAHEGILKCLTEETASIGTGEIMTPAIIEKQIDILSVKLI